MPKTRSIASLAAVALVSAAAGADAQRVIKTPEVSPAATVQQTVGLTEIAITYHRPSVRGRRIWGGLVPYDEVWRAGANDNTTFAATHDILVEGKPLAAGTYGLHMIPSEDGLWTIAFSRTATAWGSFSYDPDEDALRVAVRPVAADGLEQLRYGFDDVTDTTAVAWLHWEKLRVRFRIESPVENVVTVIRHQLRHLARFSWQGWQQAAAWCARNHLNLDEALEWVERSIAMDANAQNLGTKAQILRRLGRGEEATAAILAAVEHGSENQINQLGYQLLAAEEIDRAIEVLQKNVNDHPDSWNVYDSLAEAYATRGDSHQAIELYEKALELAPEAQKARIEGALRGLRGS